MRTRLEETGQDGGSEEDRKDGGDGMRGGTVDREIPKGQSNYYANTNKTGGLRYSCGSYLM